MFRLGGDIGYLVPFDEEQLEDPRYFSWLRDYDKIKTINRIDYVRPVSVAEVESYSTSLMQSHDDIFLAIHVRA